MYPNLSGFRTRNVDWVAAAEPADNSDGRTLSGYAAVFNSPTDIDSWEGRFTESIAPGAFRKTLQGRKPAMQWNHGRDTRVGAVPIGVYTDIREDDKGLHVEGRLFDNPVVEPVRQAIEAGAVTGMSFTFRVIRDEWRDNAGQLVKGDELYRLLYEPGERGPLQRSLKEVALSECGPVLNPAYAETSVGVRSLEELTDADRQAIAEEYRRSMIDADRDTATAARVVVEEAAALRSAHATAVKELAELVRSMNGDAPTSAPLTGIDKDADGDDDTKGVDAVVDDEEVTEDDDDEHEFVDGECLTCNAADMRSSDSPKPYGDVAYADPKNGKYPINTKAHAKAALSYISMPKNADKYSASELATIKSRIIAACKKFGIDVSDDDKSESKSDIQVSAVERDTLTGSAVTPENDNAAPDVGTLRARESQKEERAVTAPVIVRKRAVTLSELRQRLAEIDQRCEDINTEFRDAELTDEVSREYDGLKAERPEVEARIQKIVERMAALENAVHDGSRVERTIAPSVVVRKPENIYDIGEIRSQAHTDEDFVGLLRDNARRAIDAGRYSRITKRELAQESAASLIETVDDENATLARRMLQTGSPTYERAWSKAIAQGTTQLLSPDEYRALSLGTDGSGGYAVPFQLDPTVILTNAGVIDPLRQIARVEQIVGKEWQGVTSDGTTVSRAAEAAEASDNSFTLTQPTVRTNRVQGFIPFSYELAESWGQVRSEITRALVDAKAREEASAFMLGDGTGTNANGVIGTLSNSYYVNATAGQSFTAANVYSLEESLPPRFRTADAKFIAHRSTYNKVRQFDTYGGAQLWQRIGAGMPNQLLGYDALESSVMASTHATGDLFLLFGNFENFLIVDRVGMSVELIPQVFGGSGRPTGQRGIYAIWMNNSKILVPQAFRVLVGVA